MITTTVPFTPGGEEPMRIHAWFVDQLLPCPYRQPRWRPPVGTHATYTTVQYGAQDPFRIGRIW